MTISSSFSLESHADSRSLVQSNNDLLLPPQDEPFYQIVPVDGFEVKLEPPLELPTKEPLLFSSSFGNKKNLETFVQDEISVVIEALTENKARDFRISKIDVIQQQNATFFLVPSAILSVQSLTITEAAFSIHQLNQFVQQALEGPYIRSAVDAALQHHEQWTWPATVTYVSTTPAPAPIETIQQQEQQEQDQLNPREEIAGPTVRISAKPFQVWFSPALTQTDDSSLSSVRGFLTTSLTLALRQLTQQRIRHFAILQVRKLPSSSTTADVTKIEVQAGEAVIATDMLSSIITSDDVNDWIIQAFEEGYVQEQVSFLNSVEQQPTGGRGGSGQLSPLEKVFYVESSAKPMMNDNSGLPSLSFPSQPLHNNQQQHQYGGGIGAAAISIFVLGVVILIVYLVVHRLSVRAFCRGDNNNNNTRVSTSKQEEEEDDDDDFCCKHREDKITITSSSTFSPSSPTRTEVTARSISNDSDEGDEEDDDGFLIRHKVPELHNSSSKDNDLLVSPKMEIV